MQILGCDSITSEKFSFLDAHAWSRALVEFSIFPASMSFELVFFFILGMFSQINQKLCLILSKLRPTFVKVSTERQITYNCLLLPLSYCECECEYASILFSVIVILLSHRPTRKSADCEIRSFPIFALLGNQPNWLCLCLTNQLNRIYLTMIRYFSFFLFCLPIKITKTSEKKHNLNGNYGFSFHKETKTTTRQYKCYTSRGLFFSICRKKMSK